MSEQHAGTSTPTDPRARVRRRRWRWAVPVGGLALVGAAVAAVPAIASASDTTLPGRSAQQVLAAAAAAQPRPLSGTVVESAALGLPALPSNGTSTSLMSLVNGSHTARVWYASPEKVRIALVGQLAETDVIRDGTRAWVWNSQKNTAERLLLATDTSGAGTRTATPNSGVTSPQDAAKQALALVGPTTGVSVDANTTVAGRAAYEVRLVPKDARSTVGSVRIALDGQTMTPLRVQVFARGSSTPAFSTAYSAVSFTTPADSVFAFDPPAGATVTTKDLRALLPAKRPDGSTARTPGAPAPGAGQGRPQVTGTGWTSVIGVDGVDLSALGAGSGSGASAGDVGTLLRNATPVSGAWGSGRLLKTALVSVLLTDDGHLYAGAVDPALLEQAAG